MRPDLISGFSEDYFDVLRAEAPWERIPNTPRSECFMAVDTTLTYSYGNDNQRRTRVYVAKPMHPVARALMDRINAERGCAYNVCVGNLYADEHDHLGWHADDSPEQDAAHPIAVVSFGAERFIWVKPRGAKGDVPTEDRFLLTVGSLFVMPPGFQETMLHRIPKHDRPCGPRLSLTYRKLDRSVVVEA